MKSIKRFTPKLSKIFSITSCGDDLWKTLEAIKNARRRRRSRVNLLFYCSLIYNFFQWKMMRTSYIISLVTSLPYPGAHCRKRLKIFVCVTEEGKIYDYNKKSFSFFLMKDGRIVLTKWETWKEHWKEHESRQDVIFTCRAVPLKFLPFYRLPTATAAALAVDRQKLWTLFSFSPFSTLSTPPFFYYSIIYSHFDDRNSICMWKTLICFNDWVKFRIYF
jgi:hypothetical protein